MTDWRHRALRYEQQLKRADEDLAKLRQERDSLRVDRLLEMAPHAMLLRLGYSPCDIPACNCNDWHPRVPEAKADE